MSEQLEGVWNEAVVLFQSIILGILLELGKTTKNISQDCLCSGRELNQAPPDYEPETLTLGPTCWASNVKNKYTFSFSCLTELI
jgi:hypothetical protein